MKVYKIENMIATMFDNAALREALAECAHELSCHLWEADQMEMTLMPHLGAIYDGKAIETGVWETLVSWQDEAQEWYARDVFLRKGRDICWADEMDEEKAKLACLEYEEEELDWYEEETSYSLIEAVILLGGIDFSRELFGVRIYRCDPKNHETILRIVQVEHQRIRSIPKARTRYIGKRERLEK